MGAPWAGQTRAREDETFLPRFEMEDSAGNLGEEPPTGSKKYVRHRPIGRDRGALSRAGKAERASKGLRQHLDGEATREFWRRASHRLWEFGLETDLKAGTGAPWAGHWRLRGARRWEVREWATRLDSLGLDPPTGSVEEGTDIRRQTQVYCSDIAAALGT